MMDEQLYYRLIELCEKWEAVPGAVGDCSIGYEIAAEDIRKLIDEAYSYV